MLSDRVISCNSKLDETTGNIKGRNLNSIKHLLAVVGKFIMKVAGKA